jgi:DNA-binding transcriptional ArsR family regulator
MSVELLTLYARVFLGDAEEVVVEALAEAKMGPRETIRAVELRERLGGISPDAIREALQSLRAHGLVRQVALSRRVRDEPGWRLREDFPELLRELMQRVRKMHELEAGDEWICLCRRPGRTLLEAVAECRRIQGRGSAFVCPGCRSEMVARANGALTPEQRREDNEFLNRADRLL